MSAVGRWRLQLHSFGHLPMSGATRPRAAHVERERPESDLAPGPYRHLAGGSGFGKAPFLSPVHLWNPGHCGDIGLEIRKDGSWWQNGVRFSRDKLVRLFSTILRRDSDGYFLVTPHEKVVVRVEDAPFMGVRADRDDRDGEPVILVTTNVGDVVAVDAEHPLRVALIPAQASRPPMSWSAAASRRGLRGRPI